MDAIDADSCNSADLRAGEAAVDDDAAAAVRTWAERADSDGPDPC